MTEEQNSVKKILYNYKIKPSAYWKKLQEKQALEIFHLASKNVTAYQNFLSQQGIKPDKIKKYLDVQNLPSINKANYFRKFPLTEVVLKNSYKNSGLVMTATSGSTGQPTYFPRNEQIDWQYSVLADFFLNNAKAGPTLLVDCFGMGVWIGGLITYQAFRYSALRGQAVTVITPGINKKEIFHALLELAPQFEHVIIAGYPPFIKDLLDEAKQEKVDFKKFHTRLLFAAESFTENFRDYVSAAAGIKNPLLDTLNIYGSAELGAMAFETPGSIFIRRLALKHLKIFEQLFPRGGCPTLAQYNPEFVLFEQQNQTILISAKGPVPFMRYDIGDTGGVYSLETFDSAFKEHGVSLKSEAKKHGVELLHLPFVYVHERADFSTTLYGLQVYPQNIKRALENSKLEKLLSGKFNLETLYDKKSNQFLQIHLELKKNIKESRQLLKLAGQIIVQNLLKENAEYRELYKVLSEKRVKPKIKFWPYESEKYFKIGGKQKWVNLDN